MNGWNFGWQARRNRLNRDGIAFEKSCFVLMYLVFNVSDLIGLLCENVSIEQIDAIEPFVVVPGTTNVSSFSLDSTTIAPNNYFIKNY